MIQTLRKCVTCSALRQGAKDIQHKYKEYLYGIASFTTESAPTRPSLARQLQARIKATGPITIADYMKEVLTNPTAGYYMHRDVFGPSGDFVTSPEISQLFGEMLAIWYITEWRKIGAPRPLQFVEFGPGRGSLVQDILRVFARFNLGSLDGLSLHLVEVSPHLCDVQAKRLGVIDANLDTSKLHYRCGFTDEGLPVFWYSRIEDVPREFSCYLAHEFFDALPIHKFSKTDGGWREILVDLDVEKSGEKFRYVIARSATPASSIFIRQDEKREHVEVSVQSAMIVRHLATRLEEDGGFALFVDYGHDGTKGDTFRAFRSHKLHDPLVEPGSADLTADVDFSAFRDAVKDNALAFGPVTQGDFLEKMGIKVRLDSLMENCQQDQKEGLLSGYNMIVDKDKMGDRFKFFALFPEVLREHLARFPVAGFSKEESEKPDR